jgi:hypothetical protein
MVIPSCFDKWYILPYLCQWLSYHPCKHSIYEPCHDKTKVMRLRPAWIQTSLCIRAVWSGSMLFTYKLYNSRKTDSDSMDPDQTTQMRRLVWIHAARKPIMLVLLWRGSFVSSVHFYFIHLTLKRIIFI